MPDIERLDRISAAVVRLLREAREERGVTGTDLAERSGLNQSTISLMDRGLRKPTLDTLLRLADVLEVELGEILQRAAAEVGKEELVKAAAKKRPTR